MENDIICVTEHIEIHPGAQGGHAVVRDGSVYGTYDDLDFARGVADELAAEESEADPDTHLGELSYRLDGSDHHEPLECSGDYRACIQTIQERIDTARSKGATHVRWSRNENADHSVEPEELRNLGR